jgi:hypothetical protein
MRLFAIAGLAIATAGFATLATSTPSFAVDYPWCARYTGRDGGSTNCGFVSLPQCLATVHGVGGTCDRNPMFFAYADPVPHPRYRVIRPYPHYFD